METKGGWEHGWERGDVLDGVTLRKIRDEQHPIRMHRSNGFVHSCERVDTRPVQSQDGEGSKGMPTIRTVDAIIFDVLTGVERGDGLTALEWDRLDLFAHRVCEHAISTALKGVASDDAARKASGFSVTLMSRIERVFELLSKATVRTLVNDAVSSPDKLPLPLLDRVRMLIQRVANTMGVPTGDAELDHYHGLCIYTMLLATRQYEPRPCVRGDERVWKFLEKTLVAGSAASNCVWIRSVMTHVIRSCDFVGDWSGAASALQTNPALTDHVRDVVSSLDATGLLEDADRVIEKMELRNCGRPKRSAPKSIGVEWQTEATKRTRQRIDPQTELDTFLDAAAEDDPVHLAAVLNLFGEFNAPDGGSASEASQSTLLNYYPVRRGRPESATKAIQTQWKTSRVRRPPTTPPKDDPPDTIAWHQSIRLEADEPPLDEWDDTHTTTDGRRRMKYVVRANITKRANGGFMQQVIDELRLAMTPTRR